MCPRAFLPVPWTTHPDARVRVEAIRLQLTLPHERDLGIHAALDDIDPRIVHVGLTAIRGDCPAGPARRESSSWRRHAPESDENIRLTAGARLLPGCGTTLALDALLQIADGGRSFLGQAEAAAEDVPRC